MIQEAVDARSRWQGMSGVREGQLKSYPGGSLSKITALNLSSFDPTSEAT
jgi:hypothetical protein